MRPDAARGAGRRPSALAAQAAAARANPGPAWVATVAGLLNGATMVAGAGAVGWSTDHLVVPALTGADVPARAWWGSVALIGGISTVRWITILVRGVATGQVQYRSQAATRRALAERYLVLDAAWHRARPPGQLLARAVSDVDALWAPTQFAYFAFGMVFMLVLALGELFWRDPALGLVGVALVALVLGLNLAYQRLLAPRARAAQAARAALAEVAHESIAAGPVVRGLGLAQAEDSRFAPAAEALRAADVRIAAVSSVFDPVLELLPTAAVLGVLAVGAPRVAHGTLSVGDLVGVVYLLLTIAIPLNVISRFASMLPMASAGRARVDPVLAQPAARAHGTAVLTGQGPLRIELRGAEAAEGEHRLLRGVDLTCEPGTITAVVGAVGAGKSTLLELASGARRPTAGAVLLDGADTGTLGAGVLPAHVAHVSQDPFLFTESVRDNLALSGHPRAGRAHSDAEIRRALRAAAADEVVEGLPDGLDTVVGERGATLSGGQRQRLCLARALLRDPRLLVLDDATSALDPRVERRVLAGLRALVDGGGPTVLLVANRPSSVAIADHVVFLRAGRVAAAGSHSDLLAIEDYRRIVTAYDGTGTRGA